MGGLAETAESMGDEMTIGSGMAARLPESLGTVAWVILVTDYSVETRSSAGLVTSVSL